MPIEDRLATAALALAAMLLPVSPAPGIDMRLPPPANPIAISETTDFYDIGGHSVTALWHDIHARGPRMGATPWAGHARWDVRWTYDWRRTDAGCGVEHASTSLSVRYTLPRWAGRDAADSELKSKWDRFAANLRLHEQGHGANGRRAAERIQAALTAIAPEATCEALAAAVEEAARRIVDEEAAADRAYDRMTEHGVRQGVVLR